MYLKESYKLTSSKQINKKKAQGLTFSLVHLTKFTVSYASCYKRNTVFREYEGLHAAL